MFKVIVAGSREFDDYPLLKKKLDFFLQNREEIEIISGCARGADRLGERYAKEKGLWLRKFPADWEKHGKKAGYLRNEQMAKYADVAVVFWDGKSYGTKHMIDLCEKMVIPCRVVVY